MIISLCLQEKANLSVIAKNTECCLDWEFVIKKVEKKSEWMFFFLFETVPEVKLHCGETTALTTAGSHRTVTASQRIKYKIY